MREGQSLPASVSPTIEQVSFGSSNVFADSRERLARGVRPVMREVLGDPLEAVYRSPFLEFAELPDDDLNQTFAYRIFVIRDMFEEAFKQLNKMPANLLGVGRKDPDLSFICPTVVRGGLPSSTNESGPILMLDDHLRNAFAGSVMANPHFSRVVCYSAGSIRQCWGAIFPVEATRVRA